MLQRPQQQVRDGSSGGRFGRSRARPVLPVGRGFSLALPLACALTLALALLALTFPPSPRAAKAADAAGFQDTVAIGTGLDRPTNVEFSKDGRIFVADKSGLIMVYDNLSDTTATIFADLRTQVMNNGDRGLLGLALDPNFPTSPYVYVLYTYDAPIGGTAPRWGQPNTTSDDCPTPPGPTTDGCVVSGHLSKLTASGNTMTGNEQVLIEDWCQQFNSHSVGDLGFGSDGALYVSAGDGASYNYADYGQGGGALQNTPTKKNPCGDPPTGVGGTQTPPTAEGGALRSQDLRTGGDPVSLDGTILRVDPQTGQALPNNPLNGNADPNARRIIADGLRNPYRFTIRPGTSEVWMGNVGWNRWEEINRIANPTDSTVENFGWPCYEGPEKQPGYDAVDLNICENLYAAGPSAVVAPYYAYYTSNQIVSGETCGTGSQAISGVTFYEGGSYPAKYNGALFFSDYVRGCIWAMEKGTNGLPDPSKITNFISTTAKAPVDLEIGPGGDLYYVDLSGRAIHRIKYVGANNPPTAVAKANPTNGAAPLPVNFDGTSSSDADGDTLTYEWDLDGDGAYDDSTSPNPTYTYQSSGSYTASLRVSDPKGASDTDSVVIAVGSTPPVATINAPLATTTWKVGDVINFSGSATDEQDGTLPASALSWDLIMHHCPVNCHEHFLQGFEGVASGQFTTPDHEYPSYLELRLKATDSNGLTDTKSVRLDPKTVQLSFQSNPSGLQLGVGPDSAATPFSRTVIVGSNNSISAPSPQTLGGTTYVFSSWSDGGAQNHDITAGAQPSTYTATYNNAASQCTITGSSASETLTGTSGADTICGGGGNDTIKGLGGNDVLRGEANTDTLFGGAGNDTLDGGSGTDIGDFLDSPVGITASLLDGTATGDGSDTLIGLEKLFGTEKDDNLTGDNSTNTLTGRGGNDTLSGLGGNDNVDPKDGNDTARGGAGNDTVSGNSGVDQLFGDDGDDTVNSKDGVIGNDSLDGGPHVNGDTAITDATEQSITGFP